MIEVIVIALLILALGFSLYWLAVLVRTDPNRMAELRKERRILLHRKESGYSDEKDERRLGKLNRRIKRSPMEDS